jgi:hypothetical protein
MTPEAGYETKAEPMKNLAEDELKKTLEGATTPMPEPILQYFEFSHLPAHLQVVSEPFHRMAHDIVSTVPRCAERTAGLRKILEGKDCIVRAMLPTRG